jgi:two-component system osmolarity sensor histidine kinase EnvZ
MNILENAARFSTHINITCKAFESAIEVNIDDNGPGIPLHQRQDALKPFHRLDASRNQDTGGVGLGLAIAQDMVLAHGGRLQLLESPLGGLRVRIRLPL